MTYKHRRNLNVVTKAIVLLNAKYLDTKAQRPKLFSLVDKSVDPTIRDFFANRPLNRLSSPHKFQPTDLSRLKEWIKQNKPKPKPFFRPVLGHYKVYFRRRPDERLFIKGDLRIFETDGFLYVSFSYSSKGGEKKELLGSAYIDTESHNLSTVLYEGTLLSEKVQNQKMRSTFLIIQLPDTSIKSIDTLTGIAAGPRDYLQGIVGRLMVFVKLSSSGKLPKKFNSDKLNSFFDFFCDRSWIRPPFTKKVPVVYNFSHLEKVKLSFEKDPESMFVIN